MVRFTGFSSPSTIPISSMVTNATGGNNEADGGGDDEEEATTIQCSVSFLEARQNETIEGEKRPTETWRMKERMKTVSVALTLCLNIGVDPPDVVKPQPCARLECWLDPMAMSQQKALEMIGGALQKQYERWQPRARYKLSLDPTVEDVKKLAMSLRRNAKDERVLFHYNGHGVPKPTKNGEIWVFNERYTQYIPLSIYDLQTWMSTPSIFVWDCSCAGQVVKSFKEFAEQHEREMLAGVEHQKNGGANGGGGVQQNGQGARKPSNDVNMSGAAIVQVVDDQQPPPDESIGASASASANVPNPSTANPTSTSTTPIQIPNFRDCIQLGACQIDQILPTNPELPADLFTSCLTTPIKVAVLWYILQNNLTDKLPLDIIDKIPGQLSDRRTLLGELNWILTAITDTIAWNTLPRELFQTLFRQDLLVASLFRNFLLADRVMRSYHCTPVSSPVLPSTAEHPMWQAWDSVLDALLPRPDGTTPIEQQPVASIPLSQSSVGLSDMGGGAGGAVGGVGGFEYTHSTFFASQLTAFEVWLEYGYDHRGPPQQLPIVLQVLLSQVHRVRALELLGRFLDLGSWAVSLALSVGIFPYVLKLLQSFAKELRPLLSFIWAKILAVDPACQGDLIKDAGHRYFLQILSDPTVSCEQKIVPAFVLASIMDEYTPGQEAIMQGGFMSICMDLFNDCKSSLLRQWLAIGLGRLWSDFDAARWQGIRCTAYEKLDELLDDAVPEVRASAVYALGTLISNRSEQNEHATHTDHSIVMNLVQKVRGDASPLVRKELIVALHWLVLNFEKQFVTIAYQLHEERMKFFEERQQMMLMAASGGGHQNGSIVGHARQSSLSMADNASVDAFVQHGGVGRESIPRQNSMQNMVSSPSNTMLSPGGPKMTPASSFSKLFGLGGGGTPWSPSSINPPTTPRSAAENRDAMYQLETRLRNLPFPGLGALSNVYSTVWRAVMTLANDPHPDVASLAEKLVTYVNNEAQQLLQRRAVSESEDGLGELKSHPHILSIHRRSLAAGIGGHPISPMALAQQQSPGTPTSTSTAAGDQAQRGTDAVDCARIAFTALQPPQHQVRPTFMIGSPTDVASAVAAAAQTATSPVTSLMRHGEQPRTPRTRLNAATSSKLNSVSSNASSQGSPGGGVGDNGGGAGGAGGGGPSIYSTIYTGLRRPMFDSGPGTQKEQEPPGPRRTGRKPALVKTEFVDWCAKRFTRPILHLLNDDTARDEPKPTCEMPLTDWALESIEAIRTKSQTDWRSMNVRSATQQGQQSSSSLLKLDMQTFINRNPRPPTCMQFFHLYPLLCVGESHDVSLWNWRTGQYVGGFSNGKTGIGGNVGGIGTSMSYGGKITTLQIVNPLTHGFLLTGTDTGEVRIFDCNIASQFDLYSTGQQQLAHGAMASSTAIGEKTRPKLITAWTPAYDVIRYGQQYGGGARSRTEYFWEQESALLFVAGDFKTLRVWDARCEQKVQEFPIGTDQRTVTSISADYAGHNLVAVGTIDGDVRVYDRRVPPDENRIMKFRDLDKSVVKVHLQRKQFGSQLVAGSENGRIRVWDPRMFQDPVVACQLEDYSPTTSNQHQQQQFYPDTRVSAMDVHDEYELIAMATADTHTVHVLSMAGKTLNTIRYHDGFMGQKLIDVKCLKFHPYLISLGLGSADSVVATYGVSS